VSRSGLAVDGERLLSRLRELGAIGATGDGGCARLALTDADRDGRDLVVAWMRDLDLDVTVDHMGNVVGTARGHGDGPAVMCGSHIDTVGTGGLYDGNYGVLAGLEVVETLIEHGVSTRHPIAVAFFTNEEGVRYAPDMMGSLVYAGGMTVEEARDITGTDGTRLGDELDRIGYHGATPCPGKAPHAYVELHIEQGPVLEQAGATIGAVTGCKGSHGSSCRSPGSRTTPGPRRCRCAATRRTPQHVSRHSCATSPTRSAATRSRRSGEWNCTPTWSMWSPGGRP